MFDGERDSGTSYGGRPRIGTYLLINLYRLVRGPNRKERGEKRRGANLYRGTSRYCAKECTTRVVPSPGSEMAECNEA